MIKKIISILMGIAAIVIGIFILVSHFNSQKTQTAQTTATIVRIDSEVVTDTDGYDTRYYYPVVKYNVDNKDYEERLPNSGTTDSTEYKVDETLSIKYDPNNPTELSEKGDKGGLMGGIFFIACGAIITIAAFLGKVY